MSEIELSSNPTEFFQDGWPIYRKIIDNNYMFHREIYGEVKSFIEQRFQQRPISVVEMGCGDASQTAEALRDCHVSLYQGYDLSEVALGLARQNLAPLACKVNLVCTHMLDGLSRVTEPFDVVFSSFAIHHLTFDEKRRFFNLSHRTMKQDGVLLLVDVMREEHEDLATYLDGYLGYAAKHWRALTQEEFSVVFKHVSENDFPEKPTAYETMAKENGFSGVNHLNHHTWHRTLALANS
jgi:cyclopropane fatty-acyl-phospholipid synthase-like methyltransferase